MCMCDCTENSYGATFSRRLCVYFNVASALSHVIAIMVTRNVYLNLCSCLIIYPTAASETVV